MILTKAYIQAVFNAPENAKLTVWKEKPAFAAKPLIYELHLQDFILVKNLLLLFLVAAEQFSLRDVRFAVLSARIIRSVRMDWDAP